jgi:putative addiction module killer protein
MIRIQEYIVDGVSPFRRWFEGLDVQAAVGVNTAIERLSEGNTSNVKPIGEGAAELRINRGPGYRVYFGWDGKVLVILLGGGEPNDGSRMISTRRFGAGATTRNASKARGEAMPLTRDFRDTVRARAERDPAFRKALFQEAVQALLGGDVDDGRIALRSYINATIGFGRLSKVLRRPQKSLMRMLGPDGNPTAENLLGVISALQEETGVHLKIRAVTEAA